MSSIKSKGSAEVTPFTPSERSDEETLVGRTVGKYEILRIVGQGGMGRVYEALNTTIKKRVAIKCIDNALASNDEANERFQREALAASAIESPYIVQIFDAGSTEEGFPFIVMEMLRGQDLGKCITEHGRLGLGDALHFTAQILKGLHHAHQAGIIHRDLKPDNVFLVNREDEIPAVKLLDFGVSKIARSEGVPLKTLTRQGTVVGTPFYMSPEQAQAMPDVDVRSDIYSAGAILYECLSSKPPHSGRSYEQVIVNICMKDVEDIRQHNPSVPEGVAKLIATALTRERDDRYASARAMLEALRDSAPSGMSLSSPSSDLVNLGSTPGLGLRDSGAKRPSSGARIITGGGDTSTDGDAPTQLVPSTPPSKPAAELADTVTASSTVRSADIDKTLPQRTRRWPVALIPGVILLMGMVLYLRFSVGEEDSSAVAPTKSKVRKRARVNAELATPTAVAEPDIPEPLASSSASTKPAAKVAVRILPLPETSKPAVAGPPASSPTPSAGVKAQPPPTKSSKAPAPELTIQEQ